MHPSELDPWNVLARKFRLLFHANLSFSSLSNLLVDATVVFAFNYDRAFAGTKRHQGKKHLFSYAHVRSDFSSYPV